MDADVIVVGGGPAGCAAALRLVRLGHRVTIVDRAKFPRPKPCGEYLNPGAVDALDRLGTRAAVARAGVSLSGMYVAGPDGAAVWAAFPAGRGLLVPRDRLDHLLLLEAVRSGARVMEECRVDAVMPGRTPLVSARHRGRALRLTARLVIGADGLRSVVARRNGPLPRTDGTHYTVGAHFENMQAATPRGDLHLGPGWYAGAALYGGGAGNVVVAVSREEFRRNGGDAETVFGRACAALPVLSRMMVGARRLTPFVSVGPLGYGARRATDDGVLLVGDAAGTIDPMTGEGICLALRSAELAAQTVHAVLAQGDAVRTGLKAYEAARTAAFRDTWRRSRLLQRVIRHPRLAGLLLRRLVNRPGLASMLLSTVSDLRP